MKSRLFKLFSIQILTLFLFLFALRAEAGQRVDTGYIWNVGRDQCTPNDITEAQEKSCAAPIDACMKEFERLMDGIMFTFCSGANPEICKTISYRVVEFSNMGYGQQVAPAIDRFFWMNDSVKTAFQCVSNQKNQVKVITNPIVYSQIDSLNVLSANKSFIEYKKNIFLDSAVLSDSDQKIDVTTQPPVKEPAPVQPPVEEQVPAQPPVQEQAPVEAPEDKPDTEVVEKEATRELPKNEVPVADSSTQDKAAIVQPAVVNADSNPGFSGAGCTLHTPIAPTHWAVSLFAIFSFGLFVPGWFKRK